LEKERTLVKALIAPLFATLLSTTAAAAAAPVSTFMPENNLDLEDGLVAGGLNKAQFDAVITRVENIFRPLIKSKFGATLTVERRFDDPTVNAFANQLSDTQWEVHMFGGLARRPEVTEDGFAMVLCHEIGHHIGGFPFVGPQDFAADEGQADTFATGVCAAKVLTRDTRRDAEARANIPAGQRALCDATNRTTASRNVCYRATLAGKSLADLLGALEGGTVSFDVTDPNVVTETDHEHPAAQCRLDTYVAAALCGASKWNDALIPGKRFRDRNSRAAQTEAFQHSCTAGAQARPRCWFAALR
jgi:hypothetical protein